jgi:hypothetical protein
MNFLLPLVLLFAPIKAETGQFNILQDGRKIGTEQFSITKTKEGYRVEGRTTTGNENISCKMELNDKLAPTFYEYSKGQGTIRVKIMDPLSEFESISQGESSSIDFRFPERGIILDTNFFHHYLILLYRFQMGEPRFSVFIPQTMSVGSVSVLATGSRTFNLDTGDVKFEATTDADGRLMRLAVPEAKVVIER